MKLTELRARYAVSEEPLRSERRVELAVLLLAVLVVVQLLWLVASRFLPATVGAVPPAPDSMAVQSVAQTGTLTSAQSRSIRARPVFWDSRRPLEPLPVASVDPAAAAGVDAPAAEQVLKGLTLSGIVGSDEESRIIVSYRDEQLRVAPGQDVAGWTLRTVRPDEAVFEDSGREVVLKLRPRPVVAAAEASDRPAGTVDEAAGTSNAAAALRRLLNGTQTTTETETEEEPRLSLGG